MQKMYLLIYYEFPIFIYFFRSLHINMLVCYDIQSENDTSAQPTIEFVLPSNDIYSRAQQVVGFEHFVVKICAAKMLRVREF